MPTISNTASRQDFVRTQYAFTAYIRDPKNNPPPQDVEERRLRIYRELFFNNVADFLANAFPVLRKILSDAHWHALVQDYFATHLSRTPLFPEMPREFLKYLEQERTPRPEDPVFMLELAHYEWVELALSISDKEIDCSAINREGDLLTGVPVISPLAWLLNYRFPVHKISPVLQPKTPDNKPTQLLVYRDPDYEVRFIEVNPVTARLTQLIIGNRHKTSQQLLSQIAEELGHPQPDVVIRGGLDILTDLKHRYVILGVTA